MFRGFDILESWLLAPYIRTHHFYRDHTPLACNYGTFSLKDFYLDCLITCSVTVVAQPVNCSVGDSDAL
jgi:hypothetical protein